MKSYQKHLSTLLSKKPSNKTHQASAIFPFLTGGSFQTKLIFLNYWKLKRGIKDIECHYILRDFSGEKLIEDYFSVNQVKCYELNLSKWLKAPYPVYGSIEVLFKSQQNLVFPYPGVTVVYESKHSHSFVHACQRLLDQSKVANAIESGFNIYADAQTSPFLTIINGNQKLSRSLQLLAYNSDGEVIEREIKTSSAPLQTQIFWLKDWTELARHLNGKVGCVKAQFNHCGCFPRLIVGNVNSRDKQLSVTHTYYDLSKSDRQDDYWKVPEKGWDPLSILLPLIENQSFFTRVNFYPIYSPCEFWLDLELYSASGEIVARRAKAMTFSSNQSWQCLYAFDYFSSSEISKACSMRLIAQTDDRVPTRIKIGYDVGSKKGGLSCNICTNLHPANEALLTKKQAFRWAPLMPKAVKGEIWCLNSSAQRQYQQSATVTCTFYRPQDEKVLIKTLTIKPHGCVVIEHNQEISEFLSAHIGWCTFESDNPNIQTYFFSYHASGVVGGDHGF